MAKGIDYSRFDKIEAEESEDEDRAAVRRLLQQRSKKRAAQWEQLEAAEREVKEEMARSRTAHPRGRRQPNPKLEARRAKMRFPKVLAWTFRNLSWFLDCVFTAMELLWTYRRVLLGVFVAYVVEFFVPVAPGPEQLAAPMQNASDVPYLKTSRSTAIAWAEDRPVVGVAGHWLPVPLWPRVAEEGPKQGLAKSEDPVKPWAFTRAWIASGVDDVDYLSYAYMVGGALWQIHPQLAFLFTTFSREKLALGPITAPLSMLSHYKLEHLVLNLFMLQTGGPSAHKAMGRGLFFTVYLLGGLAGVWLASRLQPPEGCEEVIVFGGSGCLFALMAFNVVKGHADNIAVWNMEMDWSIVSLLFVLLIWTTLGAATRRENAMNFAGVCAGIACAFLSERW